MLTTSEETDPAEHHNVADLVHLAREEVRALNSDCHEPSGPARAALSPPMSPQIPGYELRGELHRGAQGVVFRAHCRQSGDDVAIKVIGSATGVTVSERQRFEREVELLEKLHHPAIVSTLDRGAAGDALYFVMPLIRGCTLDQYVDSRALSVRQKVALFVQAVEAVEAAHRVGVIHRDLKPSNILIDEHDRVRLIDFGLAAPFRRTDSTIDQLTQSGQFIGSLPWSSPEHASGDTALIDTRSDVYSLGVILYQIIIGAFPYSVDGGPLELLERIRNEPADSPTELEPTTPKDIETILLTCLQKDPARRYQTTAQLREDLNRWLNGEPIAATRDSLWQVARMLLARHRGALLAGAFLWLGGLGFGLLMVILYRDAADGQQFAEQQAADAKQENEDLKAKIRALEARMLKPQSWVSAIQSANELSTLSPDAGWEFIRTTWPQLEDVKTRQQFLKSVAFSRHAWTHRGMHLGMQDDSPQVQSWAMNYIRDFAFLDPAEDREGYLAWYDEYKDTPLAGAVASSLRSVAGELKQAIAADDRAAARQKAKLIGDSSALRDLQTPEIRAAVSESGLAEVLLQIVAADDRDVRRSAASALGQIPVAPEFARQSLLPLLESDDPGVVGSVARLLGRFEGDWVRDGLLAALQRGVAEENLSLVFSVADALGELGDASVIPPMIAAIESNNEYLTVYGVGYFGLSDLTGVQYDEAHDGQWWRSWWEKNSERFSTTEEASGIPEASENSHANSEGGDSPAIIAIDEDPQARYILVKGDAAASSRPPKKLLLVLPGGDGGPDFRSFVTRVGERCTGDDWLVAQLIAPRWDEKQHSRLVWPTRSNPWKGMRFSTEDQALKVIADLQRRFDIDSGQIYTLSWSSGGPAAYAMTAAPDVPVAGALVAMSVFKPDQLPALQGAAGRRVYVLHSPQDFIPMRFPENAVARLTAAGATAQLVTYEGGHGWHGDVYGNIRSGLEWLQKGQ